MKMFKYIAIALAGVAAAGLTACNDSVEYTPAAGVNTDEVYFPDTDPSQVIVKPGQTAGTIDVYRVKTDDELTVDITTVCSLDGVPSTDVFTFPQSITFAQGQSVTTIDFTINTTTIQAEENYTLDVALEGDVDTPYGLSSRTFTIYLDPWKTPVPYSTTEPANVTLSTPFGVSYQTMLYVAESETNPNQLKYTVMTSAAVNSYFDIEGFELSFIVDKDRPYVVNGEQCYLMSVPTINTGFIYESSPIILENAIDWFRETFAAMGSNYTDEELLTRMSQYNKTYSYFIPSRGLAVISFLPYDEGSELGYGYLNAGAYYVQLPGYHDYAFEYDILGNYVDSTGAEYIEMQVYKSEDIANYAVALKYGALTEAEVEAAAQAIINDPNATIYSAESTILRLPVSEEGDYTLVAVGFDEGINPVYTDSYTFEFTSVQKESDWVSVGEADYTDGFMSSIFVGLPPMTWPVQVEESISTPGLYRLVNAYRDYPENTAEDLVAGNHYIILDATNPNAVVLEESSLGTDWGYGNITVVNQASLIIAAGNATKEQLVAAGYYGTLEDGVITLPTGTAVAAMANYEGGKWFTYVNLDPENPTTGESFDPYWGEGPFRLEIYSLMPDGVRARRAPAAAAGKASASRELRQQSGLGNYGGPKAIKSVDPKTYHISASRISL